jgi:hypothetical protein
MCFDNRFRTTIKPVRFMVFPIDPAVSGFCCFFLYFQFLKITGSDQTPVHGWTGQSGSIFKTMARSTSSAAPPGSLHCCAALCSLLCCISSFIEEIAAHLLLEIFYECTNFTIQISINNKYNKQKTEIEFQNNLIKL